MIQTDSHDIFAMFFVWPKVQKSLLWSNKEASTKQLSESTSIPVEREIAQECLVPNYQYEKNGTSSTEHFFVTFSGSDKVGRNSKFEHKHRLAVEVK